MSHGKSILCLISVYRRFTPPIFVDCQDVLSSQLLASCRQWITIHISTFTLFLSFCLLQRGIVECDYIKCPPPPCNRTEQFQLPGDCCPRCGDIFVDRCVDPARGILRTLGEEFRDPSDPCKSCRCEVSWF